MSRIYFPAWYLQVDTFRGHTVPCGITPALFICITLSFSVCVADGALPPWESAAQSRGITSKVCVQHTIAGLGAALRENAVKTTIPQVFIVIKTTQ